MSNTPGSLLSPPAPPTPHGKAPQRSAWLIVLIVGAVLGFAVARQKGWIGGGASPKSSSANAQKSPKTPSESPPAPAPSAKQASSTPWMKTPVDVSKPVNPAVASTTTQSTPPSASTPKTKPSTQPTTKPTARAAEPPAGNATIAQLYRDRKSDTWVEGTARVVKLLPDDKDGDQHQKFLAEIPGTDITVRFVHNIDIAPRVPVKSGSSISFRGEYEWTDQGGTIHFTHRSKYKRSAQAGWIDFDSTRYE